ncbi:MAG: AI-2E family transporter [Sandaracinaceae bacterium]
MADPLAARPLGSKTALTLAALVVVVAGMRAAGGFFLPLLAALFLAVVSAPVLHALERVRVPRVLAVVSTLLLDVAVLAGLVALVGSSLSGFQEAVPRYQRAIQDLLASAVAVLRGQGLPIDDDELRSLGDPGWILRFVGDVLRELGAIVSNTMLVVVLVAFMLLELGPARAKLAILLGGPHARVEQLAAAARKVQRYLVVKTLLSALTGIVFGVILAVVGVDFPFLWALLAFLFNYIPSIGPAIATIPPVVVALLTLGPGPALAAALACLTTNVVIGNVVEPRMMGEAMGLSTLVVFTSMLFWGWMWGPTGALLAVPLTMLLRDALALADETRWLAVMLGSTEWVEVQHKAWGWAPPEERRSASGALASPQD